MENDAEVRSIPREEHLLRCLKASHRVQEGGENEYIRAAYRAIATAHIYIAVTYGSTRYSARLMERS